MALVQQYAELVQQVKEHQAAAAKVTSAQTAASSPSASGTVFTGRLFMNPATLLILHACDLHHDFMLVPSICSFCSCEGWTDQSNRQHLLHSDLSEQVALKPCALSPLGFVLVTTVSECHLVT